MLQVFDAVSQAVARAREGAGPTLIEAVVGRMRGHSEGDDSFQLVPADERKRFEEEDPVLRFEGMLLERGTLTQEHLDDITRKCREVILEAVDRALASSDPDPRAPGRGVYA